MDKVSMVTIGFDKNQVGIKIISCMRRQNACNRSGDPKSWNGGTVERWNDGTMGQWNNGTMAR